MFKKECRVQLMFIVIAILTLTFLLILLIFDIRWEYSENLFSLSVGIVLLSTFYVREKNRDSIKRYSLEELKEQTFIVLRNEAIKRGYINGVRIYTKTKTSFYELSGNNYSLDNRGDLYYDGIRIYRDGIWKTIIK